MINTFIDHSIYLATDIYDYRSLHLLCPKHLIEPTQNHVFYIYTSEKAGTHLPVFSLFLLC